VNCHGVKQTTYLHLFNVNLQDLKLATYLLLLPTLRMSGALPLLALYFFMVCAGKTYLYFDTVFIITQNGQIWMVNVIH